MAPIPVRLEALASALDPLHGVTDQLGRALDVELALDVLAMSLDRLDAQAELLGDLAGAHALAHPAKDLELAIAERLERGLHGGLGHLVEHALGDLGADGDGARHD